MDKIIAQILSKVNEEAKQEQDKPNTLGIYRASSIGGCHRALQYAILKEHAESLTPETHLIFRDGHLHHRDVRELLAKVGIVSHVEFNVQKRYKTPIATFIVSGTLDLMFNGLVTDIKSISTFRFKGLDKQFPNDYMNYVIQLQLYMDIMQKDKGCIIFKDKNSAELKIFYLDYNAELMENILEGIAKLHRAVKNKKMIDRPYARNDWHCRLCQYRLACWKLPMEGKHWGPAWTGPRKARQGVKDDPQSDLRPVLRQSLKEAKRRKPGHPEKPTV